MANYALVIGVENYVDAIHFPKVDYAVEDARSFSESIEKLDYDVTLLIENDVTLGRVLGKANELAYKITSPEDKVIVYFAGHGQSINNKNYLCLSDTYDNCVEATGMEIQSLINIIGEISHHVILFIDCCHSGIKVESGVRAGRNAIDYQRLFHDLEKKEYVIEMTACKDNESSYSDDGYEHGIWTYHLLNCLNGLVPEVLDGTFIFSTKLQKYLLKKVKADIIRLEKKKTTDSMEIY